MAVMKVTPEMMAQALAETDWAKVDATTDADIDRQIAGDADTAPILSDADMVAILARDYLDANLASPTAARNSAKSTAPGIIRVPMT